jgi:hypothetical protein
LYSPVTWIGEPTYDVSYADALDWTLDSQYLLYDCYHESPTNSESIAYWSINRMNGISGEIYNIFPYQPMGVNIGNPVFASNSEYIFAYDYADASGNTAILAANMETGDEGVIMADNFGKIGYPTYNPEDNMIAFHSLVQNQFGWSVDGIGQIQLEPDKINGKATAVGYLVDATFPVWFAIGSRTDVETEEPMIPFRSELGKNYPNPFNPETVIPFQVPEPSSVRLLVYNLKGERVAVLVDEALAPGRYKIRWQGKDMKGHMVPSGVYVYRLEIGEQCFSHKMTLVR